MHETFHTNAEAQTEALEEEKLSKQLWQNPEIKSLVINFATEAPAPGSGPQLVG